MTPEDIAPILILGSYRCHMMASVVQKIQEFGAELMQIPGGCTSLCQPVDIGFKKAVQGPPSEAVDIVDNYQGHCS
jgi:hypothetical protein